MTAVVESDGGADLVAQAVLSPMASAPWPFVDRRLRPRDPDQMSDLVPEAGSPEAARSPWLRRLVLCVLVADLAAAAAAVLLAQMTAEAAGRGLGSVPVWAAFVGPAAWLAVLVGARAYQPAVVGSGAEEYRRVLNAGLTLGAAAASASYMLRADVSRSYLLTVCILTPTLTVLGRHGARNVLGRLRSAGRCMHDVILAGHEEPLLHLVNQIHRERNGGLRVIGVCVPHGHSDLLRQAGVPVLGGMADVAGVARRHGADTVAVTASAEMHGGALRRLAWQLEGSGIELVVAPGLVEVAGPRLHIRLMCGLPLLHVEQPELHGLRHLVKSSFDRLAALAALILLSPLLICLAVVIRRTSEGPSLYAQQRVGRGGRVFTMWKFRSMQSDAEQALEALAAADMHAGELLFKVRRDPRVTPVGRWMRRYSLDEVPQLLNVLRGDMSLVGPRPPLPSEVSRYGADVQRRLLVKPGLTGLWQVSGRADLSWDESIRLDLRYVENWSLALDALIICKTFSAVVRGRGAY